MTMNLNHLSNSEFISYLDKHSVDPVVLRLVNIISHPIDGLLPPLYNMGLDVNLHKFTKDGISITPAEYIDSLLDKITELRTMYDETWDNYITERDRADALENRTVAELITSLQLDIQRVTNRAIDAETRARVAVDQKQIALDKLKMWSTLATE